MVKKMVLVLVLVMLLLPAIGCGVFDVINQEYSRIFKPSSEDDQEIMADCFRNFNLSAWQDENGNGIWEDDETPLEGVEISVDGNFAQRWPREPGLSNEEGQCIVRIWYPGFCSENDYNITATPPEGFEPTTQNPLTLHFEASGPSSTARFGFRLDDNN